MASFWKEESGFSSRLLQIHPGRWFQSACDLRLHVDVACGEGYYSRQLAQQFDKRFSWPFDLSGGFNPSCGTSKSSENVAWFVGDLAQLPYVNTVSMSFLDIFSPANYQALLKTFVWSGLDLQLFLTKIICKSFANWLPEAQVYSNQDVLINIFKSPCELAVIDYGDLVYAIRACSNICWDDTSFLQYQ